MFGVRYNLRPAYFLHMAVQIWQFCYRFGFADSFHGAHRLCLQIDEPAFERWGSIVVTIRVIDSTDS